ncbi:MAG: flagellar filament capping protein FliD [Pseudomonadota bacterium]
MTSTINNLGNLNPNGISATDLYSRVNQSLLSKNAAVKKLSEQVAGDQTRLSGLGQLQSALANFAAVAQSLSGVGLQTAASATTPAVLSAFTTGTAKTGTHAVDVKQLAQAQVLNSQAQSSQTGAIGTGAATTIKIEFGTTSGSSFAPGSSKTISIDSANNTLQGIAAAFKNAGVDAKVVQKGNAYSLQLTAPSGAAATLRIGVGGDATLNKLLTFNPGGQQGLVQASAGQDARLTVDGKDVTSTSNVVTGAIGGTALALTAKGKTDVIVAQDPGQIAKNVGTFVKAFNSLSDQLGALGKGGLKSDAALGQVQGQLASILGQVNGKAGLSLQNGKLQVDSKALGDAIAANPEQVAALFTDQGKGVADQLGSKIGQLLGTNGAIGKEAVSIGKDITALGSKKESLTKALTAQAQSLASQYAQATGQDSGSNSALPGYSGPSSLFDFFT